MRIDVFNAKTAAKKNIDASGAQLTTEQKRLVDKMLLDGKRAGLALPEEKRNELTDLKKQLSQTTLEFSVRHHPFPRMPTLCLLWLTISTNRKTLMRKMWVVFFPTLHRGVSEFTPSLSRGSSASPLRNSRAFLRTSYPATTSVLRMALSCTM